MITALKLIGEMCGIYIDLHCNAVEHLIAQ